MNKLQKSDNFEMSIDKNMITEKIYRIRGVQVMLDFELAEIYGYTTKRFNEQVKNNIERFDEDFRFQLSKDEFDNLRSKKSTSSWGGTRYLPYAFTEQGIYMLMTVLKGELAVKQSKALIRAFKTIKDFIIQNEILFAYQDYLKLSTQVNENLQSIHKIKETMITKDYLDEVMKEFIGPNRKEEYLFLNGEKFSANLAYEQIYNTAKKSIYIIDNYIGLKTLIHFKKVLPIIDIIIFSDNIKKGLSLLEFNDFQNEYKNVHITFKTTNGKYHDRYIILDYGTNDEIVYHCGASSKDAGNKITSIVKIKDTSNYQKMINELLVNPPLILK